MTKTSYEFQKEFNLTAKDIFSRWLKTAIDDDDFESFKDCVVSIGTEWHVARTVESDLKDEFIRHLWDMRKAILDGTYTGWTESDYDAYSYESKVCFLMNPCHYKLIYDSNNRTALKSKAKKWLYPNEWQQAVDSYYKENQIDTTDSKKIFETDFELWYKENNKQ